MNLPISVVIPAFNGSAFIGEALESVFRQTLLPREIIVVDDASTDDTCHVVRSILRASPVPVRLLERHTNSGHPGVPICEGVNNAGGELVAVLDQDDVHLPQSLQQHQEALAARSACTVSFSLGALMDVPQTPMIAEEIIDQLKLAGTCCKGVRHIPGVETIRLLLANGNFIRGFPGFVFRRSAWGNLEQQASRWRIAFDLVVLRALLLQGDACFIPTVGYLRRVHDTNATRQVILVLEELLRFSDETVSDRLPSLAVDAGVREKHRSWRCQLADESRRSESFGKALLRHVGLLRCYGRDAAIVRSLMRLPGRSLPLKTRNSLRRIRTALAGWG